MTQIEELVSSYYTLTKTIPLPGFKINSIKAVTELLENGVQANNISKAINYYMINYKMYSDKPYLSLKPVFSLEDIKTLLNVRPVDKDNLIELSKFYYHKRLRLMPKPPMMTVDEKGNASTIIEPFFLEMIKTFTIEFLLDYFYESHQVPLTARKGKRDIAALKYVVNTYKDCIYDANWLDIILYMIDVSRQIIIDKDSRPITNIFHIQDYERQALDLLEDKMNYERINGVDKIVQRRTMDSGNGWTK